MQLHFTVSLDENGADLSRAITAMTLIRNAVFPVTDAPASVPAPAQPAPAGAGTGVNTTDTPRTRSRKAATAQEAAIDAKALQELAKPLIQRGMIDEIRKQLSELGAKPPKLENLPVEKYQDFAKWLKAADEPIGGGAEDELGL